MISNVILLGAWQLLTVAAVPEQQIAQNRLENQRALQTGVKIEPGRYIENQPQLGRLKFGRGFDFDYGGCSVIAVYNTLLSLGEQMSGEALCEIAEELQRRGVALGGKFGVAPLSLKRYMKRHLAGKGITVTSTTSNRRTVLDQLGAESDAVLVVLWNGRRLRDQFHAVHIEKREDKFIIHNACYLIDAANHGKTYCEKGPYGSLSEAVKGYAADGAGVVLALGMKKQAGGEV